MIIRPKEMKKKLKILLIVHIISLLFVNIVAFKGFTEKETKRLNSLGRHYLIICVSLKSREL